MGLWASASCSHPGGDKDDSKTPASQAVASSSSTPSHVLTLAGDKKQSLDWDWRHYVQPRTWLPTLLATTALLGTAQFYRSYLRRIPSTNHIAPGFFRRRSLLGKVTSVGDGDNFHLFHTPGGCLAGWGWVRKVPDGRKVLKGRTIPVRIAGVDAPEGAHFGRPAQPFSSEALAFLQQYLLGRRVRAYIYRRDQYERVVATVFVRKPPFFLAKDVGLEMLRRGLATTYEAKSGVEFGGARIEAKYRAAEETARQKGRGMWALERPGFFRSDTAKELESPRQYKDRMRHLDEKAALKAQAKKRAGA